MRARPTSKSIWAVSYPMILVGISETIIEVTDTIFLGRYGVTELGAVGIADAIHQMMLVTTIGLADGLQVVMGRRAGRGSAGAMGRAFNQGLYLLAISSLLVFAAIRWGGPLVTAACFSDDEVRRATD